MSSSSNIRVLIADDHPIVREGLRGLLSIKPGFDVIGEAEDGDELVQQAIWLKPDVVLMDLVMPRTDGLAAIRAIKAAHLDARILVLTSFTEDSKIFAALDAGALGVLLKDSSPQELIRAIRDVHDYHAMVQSPPEGSVGFVGETGPMGEFAADAEKTEASYTDRAVNINKIGQEILDADDPPIRMLWAANKNVLSQDFDRNKIARAFETLEMVVVVDQFFTQTAELADIVLPTTTLFEDWTVNVSYWHYWLGINEQAIQPLFEAKSDIVIASALSAALNAKVPGSCTYEENLDPKAWMEAEFNDGIYNLFGTNSWEDLLDGPVKANAGLTPWADGAFGTPSGKYEFKSELAAEHGHFDVPKFKPGRKAYAPYRLLTPHDKFSLHSQFHNIDWMHDFQDEPFLYLHPTLAQTKGIAEGNMVRVFNPVGEEQLRAKLTNNVPADALLMYENWFGKGRKFNVNKLVDDTSSDMGKYKTGSPGVAIHDQFADIEKA